MHHGQCSRSKRAEQRKGADWLCDDSHIWRARNRHAKSYLKMGTPSSTRQWPQLILQLVVQMSCVLSMPWLLVVLFPEVYGNRELGLWWPPSTLGQGGQWFSHADLRTLAGDSWQTGPRLAGRVQCILGWSMVYVLKAQAGIRHRVTSLCWKKGILHPAMKTTLLKPSFEMLPSWSIRLSNDSFILGAYWLNPFPEPSLHSLESLGSP